MKKLIIFSILLLSVSFAQGTRFDKLVNDGLNGIYNLKFNEAYNNFNTIKKEFPKSAAPYFLESMIPWWKITFDYNNESYDEDFYNKVEQTIDFCDDILDKKPNDIDAMFFKGAAIGFRGRLKALRDEWFDAASDGKEAMPLVYEVSKKDPSNVDVVLGLGIYNYYAAKIPERYPIVKPLMLVLPPGDIVKGMNQLKNVAENGKFTRTEAKYFLMNILTNSEKKPMEAEKYALELTKEFPDNPSFLRYLGKIHVQMSGFEYGADTFSKILERCRKKDYGFNEIVEREAHYYLGMKYYNTNQVDLAINHFGSCKRISDKIEKKRNSSLLINSTLFLGKLYDQKGDREKAIKKYEEVLDLPEIRDSHKEAEEYLKVPFKRKFPY